jgi:hypothetical protein
LVQRKSPFAHRVSGRINSESRGSPRHGPARLRGSPAQCSCVSGCDQAAAGGPRAGIVEISGRSETCPWRWRHALRPKCRMTPCTSACSRDVVQLHSLVRPRQDDGGSLCPAFSNRWPRTETATPTTSSRREACPPQSTSPHRAEWFVSPLRQRSPERWSCAEAVPSARRMTALSTPSAWRTRNLGSVFWPPIPPREVAPFRAISRGLTRFGKAQATTSGGVTPTGSPSPDRARMRPSPTASTVAPPELTQIDERRTCTPPRWTWRCFPAGASPAYTAI